jgi:hypothetical protein
MFHTARCSHEGDHAAATAGLQRAVGSAGMTTPAKIHDPANSGRFTRWLSGRCEDNSSAYHWTSARCRLWSPLTAQQHSVAFRSNAGQSEIIRTKNARITRPQRPFVRGKNCSMSLLWMVRSRSPGFSHRSERVPSSFPVAALCVRSALHACRSRFRAVAQSAGRLKDRRRREWIWVISAYFYHNFLLIRRSACIVPGRGYE